MFSDGVGDVSRGALCGDRLGRLRGLRGWLRGESVRRAVLW